MSESIAFSTLPLSRRHCDDEAGHDRKVGRQSGIWLCTLETQTLLSIKSYFAAQHQEGSKAFIPGSSLRGMVRNAAEVLGAGCARYFSGGYPPPPPNLAECSYESACLVCRIFGFVNVQKTFAGKVRFTDTGKTDVRWQSVRVGRDRPPVSDEPGWVVFPYVREPIQLPPGDVWCVQPKQQFRFRVDYINLDAEELALMKFALTLRAGDRHLCHMLGYAKSLGLGACRISIEKDKLEAPSGLLQPYLDQPGFQKFARLRTI